MKLRLNGKLIINASFIAVATLPVSAVAWDGYDYDKGVYVEITKRSLVRPGRTIEVYEYGEGQYRYFEVESVRKSGASVEVEVTDSETGESRTFDMDNKR
jgi:hypothetical protein